MTADRIGKKTVLRAPRSRVPMTYPGYEHMTMEATVVRMDPETLVEFRLDEVADGTLLTVIESGFEKLPAGRRDEAFRANEGGWAEQLDNITRYLTR